MSDHDPAPRLDEAAAAPPAARRRLMPAGISAGLCVLVAMVLSPGAIGIDVAWHLATGFAGFLRENLGRISTDAGTWAPGLAAFLLALGISHHFLTRHARRRDRCWNIVSTLCLGLVLPLLFVIAFLVPGALLHLRGLSREDGLYVASDIRAAMMFRQAKEIATEAIMMSVDDGALPLSLKELSSYDRGSLPISSRKGGPPLPPEPPIYLGGGMRIDDDPSLPLAISSPFVLNGTVVRAVVLLGGETLLVPDREIDAWLHRLPARAQPAH